MEVAGGFPPQKLKLKIELISRHFWLRHTGVPGFLHYTPIWRRAHGCCAPNFPLYHTFNNLSIDNLHKYKKIFFPDFVHFAYCNLLLDVILYLCQGEGTLPRVGQLSGVANCWQRSVQIPNKSARNFFKRNFEKPLDNLNQICYNGGTPKERK